MRLKYIIILFLLPFIGYSQCEIQCSEFNKCGFISELSFNDSLNQYATEINALVNHPAVSVPIASSSIPIADNETDTAIRTGQVGSSTDYARADHNHPIRRQANPGYPVWAWNFSNGTTQTANVDYGFWSDEEAVYFRHRFTIEVEQGTGWNWVNVPAIAGFQRPQITTLTTYHAEPDVNYEMNSDAAEWTNIPRIYLDHFRKGAEDDDTWFVQVVTKYIRL